MAFTKVRASVLMLGLESALIACAHAGELPSPFFLANTRNDIHLRVSLTATDTETTDSRPVHVDSGSLPPCGSSVLIASPSSAPESFEAEIERRIADGEKFLEFSNREIAVEQLRISSPDVSLEFKDCVFQSTLSIRDSQFRALRIKNCRLGRVMIDGCQILGDVGIVSACETQQLAIVRSVIDGSLSIDVASICDVDPEEESLAIYQSEIGLQTTLNIGHATGIVLLGESEYNSTLRLNVSSLSQSVKAQQARLNGGMILVCASGTDMDFSCCTAKGKLDFRVGRAGNIALYNSVLNGGVDVCGLGAEGSLSSVDASGSTVLGLVDAKRLNVSGKFDLRMASIEKAVVFDDVSVGGILSSRMKTQNVELKSSVVGREGFYLDGASVSQLCQLRECVLDGPLVANRAAISTLLVEGCTFRKPLKDSKGCILATGCSFDFIVFTSHASQPTTCYDTLMFNESRVSGRVTFEQTQILGGAEMEFESCTLAGTLCIGPGFVSEGKISLARSLLEKDLVFRGAKLEPKAGPALMAEAMTVNGVAVLSQPNQQVSEFKGTIVLRASMFGAPFNGDRVRVEGAPSLNLDYCKFESGLSLASAELKGSIQATNIKCDGDVSMNGITVFSSSDAAAIDLSRGRISGSVKLDSFDVTSTVKMSHTLIDSRLVLADARNKEYSLELTGARVNTLEDDQTGWPRTAKLGAFKFTHIARDSGIAARKEWLALDPASPIDPIWALAEYYKAAGMKNDYRDAVVVWEKETARNSISRQLLGWFTGYGEDPLLRPFGFLALLLGLGTGAAIALRRRQYLVARKVGVAGTYVPMAYSSLYFAVGILLPWSTNIRDDFAIREHDPENKKDFWKIKLLEAATVIYMLSGYLILSVLAFALAREVVKF